MNERRDELAAPGGEARTWAGSGGSGGIEELPDGSISIPVLEEELVVTKRPVVRARVVIRKRTTTKERRVEAELRRERLEIESHRGLPLDEKRLRRDRPHRGSGMSSAGGDEDLLPDVSTGERADVEDGSLVRHEQELRIEKRTYEAASVRARKFVETHRTEELVPYGIEDAEIERVGPNENDSGDIETLPDGSVSVPVFEEDVIASKRTIVRERVIIHRDVVAERHSVETEVLKERVEVDTDPPGEATGCPRPE